MERHNAFLRVNPAALSTAQQKGVDFKRKRVFTKPQVRMSHQLIAAALGGIPSHELVKMSGPVHLRMYFVYPLGSKPKRYAGEPKVTRPDLDNLGKVVIDAIAQDGRFFADDAQIYRLTLEKWYGNSNDDYGIRIFWGEWQCHEE